MVKVLSSFVRGPLEPYVTGFAEELLRQGYSRSSAGPARVLHRASGPLDARGGRRAGPAERAGDRAVSGRAMRGWLSGVSVAEGGGAAAVLPRSAGCASAGAAVALGPVEALLGGYRAWLLAERGLTPIGRSAATWTARDRSSPAGCAEMFWIWPG